MLACANLLRSVLLLTINGVQRSRRRIVWDFGILPGIAAGVILEALASPGGDSAEKAPHNPDENP